MRWSRAILVLVALLAAACSMRSAIDALSSPEDRAFAQDFVAKVRGGDVKSLQPMFDPSAWSESEPQLAQSRRFFPESPGITELIGYQITSSIVNGASSQTKNYTLVTHDASHWTTTVIQTRSNGNGPHRVVAWNVTGGAEVPPVYQQYQSMEAAVPWLRAGLAVGLIAAVAFVVWLIRRRRRKRLAG
jgi:hypothetical protein